MSKTIWVTGDIHGSPDRFSFGIFPEGKTMTKDDVVEILGDFGLVWDYEGESKTEKYWLDWLDRKPWTTVATLGNHENYDRIKNLPVEKRFGAPVWVVRPSVFLLQSGYVYEINGRKIWNFNGASSHDISDGIIDSRDPDWRNIAKRMEKRGKTMFRIDGVSWWKEEIEQDDSVYERGVKGLEEVGYDVDFVWTHCAPNEAQKMLGFFNSDRLTDYFQKIDDDFMARGKAPVWLFGHYHDNKQVCYHKYLLYEQIVRIS